ncbi:unnamed protein product [Amoebophrya sp. A120]|nr:unnamed protein product [Amoebophrya sp. A120]|eukprot:GSA120T00005102001.1
MDDPIIEDWAWPDVPLLHTSMDDRLDNLSPTRNTRNHHHLQQHQQYHPNHQPPTSSSAPGYNQHGAAGSRTSGDHALGSSGPTLLHRGGPQPHHQQSTNFLRGSTTVSTESLEVGQLRQYLMERDAVIGQLESLLQEQSTRFRESMQQVQADLFTATKSEKDMQVLLRSRQSQDAEEKNRLSLEKQRLEHELEYAAKEKKREEAAWRQRAEDLQKELSDTKLDQNRLQYLEKENGRLKEEISDVERQLAAKTALVDKLENEKIDLEKGSRGRLGGFAAERQNRLERERLEEQIRDLRKQLNAREEQDTYSAQERQEAEDEVWLEKIRQNTAYWEQQIEEQKHLLETAETRVKELEDQNQDSQSEQILALQGKLRLEKRVAEEQGARHRQLELEKEELEARLNALRNEVEEARTSAEQARADGNAELCEEFERRVENLRRDTEARIQEKEEEATVRLRHASENYDAERRDFVARINELEKSVTVWREKFDSLAAPLPPEMATSKGTNSSDALPLPDPLRLKNTTGSTVIAPSASRSSSVSSAKRVQHQNEQIGGSSSSRARSPSLVVMQRQKQLKERIAVLESENNDLKARLQKRGANRVDASPSEVRTLRKRLAERETELAHMQHEMRTSSKRRGSSQSSRPGDASMRSMNSSFQRQGSSEALVVPGQKSFFSSGAAPPSENHSRIEEAVAESKHLRTVADQAQQRQTTLETTLSSVTAQLRESERRLAEEAEASRKLDTENFEYRKRIRDLETENRITKEGRADLEGKLFDLSKELADAAEKHAAELRRMERQIGDEASREVRDLQKSEAQLHKELEEVKPEVERLRSDLRSSRERIAQLEDQYDSEASRCTLLEQTIEILKKEKSLLQDELRDLERQFGETGSLKNGDHSKNAGNPRSSTTSRLSLKNHDEFATAVGAAGRGTRGAGTERVNDDPDESYISHYSNRSSKKTAGVNADLAGADGRAHGSTFSRRPNAPNFVASGAAVATPAAGTPYGSSSSRGGQHHYAPDHRSTPGSVLFGRRREVPAREDDDDDVDHYRENVLSRSDYKAARNTSDFHPRMGDRQEHRTPTATRNRYNDPQSRPHLSSTGRATTRSTGGAASSGHYNNYGNATAPRRKSPGILSSSEDDVDSVFLSRRATAVRKPVMSRQASTARRRPPARSESSSEGSLERIVRESDPLFRGSKKR